MLVQALAEYADTRLSAQLDDIAFEEKPVPYLIEIGAGGRFLAAVAREKEVTQGKKKFKQSETLSVPRSPVARVSGLHPLLGCDDIKYILGVGGWTGEGQQQNHEERHVAFIRLLSKAAGDTEDPALAACSAFYERTDQLEAAREALKGAKPGSYVALSVEGPVTSRPAVRRWWRDHYARSSAARTESGGTGMCLVCGEVQSIAPTHDKIKGLSSLGGQPSGVSLMSFDKDAFRSYGWDQNANSPVCQDRAMAYVLALNDLLKRDGAASRVDHGSVGFIFWTRKPAGDSLMSLIEDADPDTVRALLRIDPAATAQVEDNDFYLLGVSGNGGRLLVRYWIHETLGQIRVNVRNWFQGQSIVDAFTGEPAPPPKLWQLLATLARDPKDVPAAVTVQLVRRALLASPLGNSILAAALARLRLPLGRERLRPARIGLVRLCVNDQSKGEPLMSDLLDPSLNHLAYLCGRLLAIYDGLQYKAQGEVGVTVADRYYSLASTFPALAFPKIEDLGLKHLRKLRRDNRGAAINIDKSLQEIHSRLAEQGAKFPPQLKLEDQGRFAIGFHHQRAETMRRAQQSPVPEETTD